MAQREFRLAILHDDPEVAAHLAQLAAEANLAVSRVPSLAALEGLLGDASLSAVAVDLVGPNSGGFELLERLARVPTQPQVIAVTALDAKTVDSTRRLASAKGLKIEVFRKDSADDRALKACFAGLSSRRSRFDAKDLEDAIDRDLLRLEYQPKVPLTAAVAGEYGVEALCRISHPEFGIVAPDRFIGLAEKEGLIGKLTDAVVCKAFRDWRTWHDRGLVLRLALNVSPELLRTTEWCERFMRRCAEFEIDPAHITLEITESSHVASQTTALDILTRLRLKGFTLSIDDFGTGFSSLATLYKLPFGELKIDKSFTLDLQDSREAHALVGSTIEMAQRLGIEVCAEGVESEVDFRELRRMGCSFAQGYFVSKSIPPENIPGFFAGWATPADANDGSAALPGNLPKIAMIQALMNDILSEEKQDGDRTIVFSQSGPHSCAAEMREDGALELARKIPSLVLKRQFPEALAQCHAVVERLEQRPVCSWKPKIRELQRILESELLRKDDLELMCKHGAVRLLPRSSAFIGRVSRSKTVDVPIGCRWLSRGEKNLRLFMDNEGWFIEDLGSTNGSFLGEERLRPGQPRAIPVGETLIEIGKKPGTPAPVAFRFRRPRLSPNAVAMTLMANPSAFGDAGVQEWPTWKEDLQIGWIFFHDRFAAGRSADCALVLQDCAAELAAEIRFAEGFWIAPAGGAELTVSGISTQWAMPLPVAADVSIGGAAVSTRRIEDRTQEALPENSAHRSETG